MIHQCGDTPRQDTREAWARADPKVQDSSDAY